MPPSSDQSEHELDGDTFDSVYTPLSTSPSQQDAFTFSTPPNTFSEQAIGIETVRSTIYEILREQNLIPPLMLMI